MSDRLPVLLLATCFPHPQNLVLGTWALSQARALSAAGADLRVASLTSWLPAIAGRRPGLAWMAQCPAQAEVGGLMVDYPRWPVYMAGPPRRWAWTNPGPWAEIGWRAARGRIAALAAGAKVVFAHHTVHSGYVAWRWKQQTGTPYVLGEWDFDEITACEALPRRRALYEQVMGDAAAIVCTSDRMTRDIARLFPRARPVTVHMGIEPVALEILDRPRPAELAGRRVVFSASGFFARKAVPLLVRAFATATAGMDDVVLRLGGDGPDRAACEAEARRLGIESRVAFLGKLTREQVYQEMAWCDAFALVGYDEPFATVYLEAMACGRPVLTASDGGITDVVVDRVHGRVVPPKDEAATAVVLREMLEDREGLRRMGNAAKALFDERLTAARHGSAVLALLESAAGGTK